MGALHAVPEDGLGVGPSTNHDLVRVMRADIGGWQAHVRIVTRLNLLRRAHTWFQCYKCKINNGWDMTRSLHNGSDSRSVHYCERTWQSEMSNCVAANMLLLSWCLMSSDVIWHIRDKLWPMPKHGSIRKVYACFSCNLPPALLAEWPGFFTCYCGNTGVERIPK